MAAPGYEFYLRVLFAVYLCCLSALFGMGALNKYCLLHYFLGSLQSATLQATGFSYTTLPERETTASNRLNFHRACVKCVTPHVMHLTSLPLISREISTQQAHPNAAVTCT